jgi:hypothetical protein
MHFSLRCQVWRRMSLGRRLNLDRRAHQRRPRNLLTARRRRTANPVGRRSDIPRRIAAGSGPSLRRFGVPTELEPSPHAVDERRGGSPTLSLRRLGRRPAAS